MSNTRSSPSRPRPRASRPAANRAGPGPTPQTEVPPRPSAKRRASRSRAARQARARRWHLSWIGAIAVVAAAGVVIAVVAGGGSSRAEVLPPPVAAGAPDVQAPALTVANPTKIAGLVAYDTTGWPTASHNGPASRALGHNHVAGPVTYSVTPPVGGDHNGVWANCGIYTQPIVNERAVHDLEHGAVWITYQPNLPSDEVFELRMFVEDQSRVGSEQSRYMDMSPYPGLPSPIVISSWGYQLKVNSPTDPRLQAFVNTFRFSPTYSPEYPGECTGGVGTPAQT